MRLIDFVLFFLFVLLLFDEVLLHPTRTKKTLSEKRIKPSCFYGVVRHSKKETVPRVAGTIVSTICSGDLTKIEEAGLETRQREHVLFGSPSAVHLIRARGGSDYDDSNELKETYICKGHINELYTSWESMSYKHIRRTRGDRKIMCSYPFEEHDVVFRDKNHKIYYVSYEEAKNYLAITGRNIHPGTPVCHDHHMEIQSIIETALQKEKDDDYCPAQAATAGTSTTVPEKTIDERIACAFFDFTQIAGIQKVKWRKSFSEYTEGTKRKKAAVAKQVKKAVLHAMAPGHEDELETMMDGKSKIDWDFPYEMPFENVMEIVNYEFLNAPTKRLRDFVLSLVAGRVSFPILRRFIPSLSVSKYQRAQKISLSGNLHEVKETTILERYDYDMVSDLIQFITGIMANAEIVHQFTNAMKSLGRTKILSASSIIRLLKAIPADTRHSEKCVDQFVARGFYAFQHILKSIDRLFELGLIDREEQKELRTNVMELDLYLRSDYKLHLKFGSLIAEHCFAYGLSDPNDENFRVVETHSHETQCPRCAHFVLTFRALHSRISDLISEATPGHLKDLKEIQFLFKSDQETIEQLRNHELRSGFSTYVNELITSSLTEGQCKVTLDFAQRWDPSYHLEEQQQFYTKGSGLSMHFSHALCKMEGQFVQHTWIHLIEGGEQDSVTVTNILEHVMIDLHKVDITLIHIRSDNGAPYHSAQTIGSIPSIAKRAGIVVETISFSEACRGKGPCDRMTAVGKDRLRRELHKGIDIDSYQAVYAALTSEPKLRGVTVVLAKIDRSTVVSGWKLDKISNYGFFKLNGDGTMTVWKYFNIGKGFSVSGMTEVGGDMPIVKIGGRKKADRSIVQVERYNIAHNIPCEFWVNDVKEARTMPDEEEPMDTDDEIAKAPSSKRNVLHYCHCGSSFVRFQNLMNHLEWGTHKVCPEKTTMIDLGIGMFKKTVEDFPTASLLPIQDAVNGAIDDSVPVPPQGFALRSKRRGGRLPEDAKKIVVDYFWKVKREGKTPVTLEAFNILNESGIPPEKRLTYQQIKSLYGRMWKLPIPTSRARRNHHDDDGEELGEWEQEWDDVCDPLENVGYDDIIDKFIHLNLPRFFDMTQMYPRM